MTLFGNLSAGLFQPGFDKGVNKAWLTTAKEARKQAALNFPSRLLNAGQEVSNALHNYDAASQKFKIRKAQLSNLIKAVDYTQQLVRYGFANYTEVLTVQSSLLNAQLSEINDNHNRCC